MRIGIIGAGVSGMVTAWLLQEDHDVTLFDREEVLGGHAQTVPVEHEGQTVLAETGPRFFFDVSYPYFLTLLRLLEVRPRWCPARVSFTRCADRHTLVLPPRLPRHIWSLLRSPRVLRHVLSLRKLSAATDEVANRRDWSMTLRDYLAADGYPGSFGPELIYPFLAASWGAPLHAIPGFPVYSLLKGMRSSPGRGPGFYEIDGGMAHYIRALGRQLSRVDVRLGTAINRVSWDGSFSVEHDLGRDGGFDQIVVASSARDAARLLSSLPPAARHYDVVRRFTHFDTDIAVHGDPSFMPSCKDDWSHVNLFHDGDDAFMTDWSGWRRSLPVFRTWLPRGRALPRPLYARRPFHHLLMSPENAALQRRIAALQGRGGIWLVGMYAVDVDNHESALLSAIPVAQTLAPRALRLHALLDGVGSDAAHDLSILPIPDPAELMDRSAPGPSG